MGPVVREETPVLKTVVRDERRRSRRPGARAQNDC
jgi:hypothetical protein